MDIQTDRTFDGTLLHRGDAAFEQARLDAVWNGRKPDRHPAAILLARSDSDVTQGVLLASELGLKIGVRSGGHSWIGNGIRDDVLLLDLSALDEVVIHADLATAEVQPAAKGETLNALLEQHDLVFPTGHCPSVGMGGYLLGGGYGWNSRALGPACMSVDAIDVVLADGSLVHADDRSHPELMWAARGAGPGFFGIVTRYYIRLHPAYTKVMISTYLFAEGLRDEVLAWTLAELPKTSRSLELSVKVSHSPGHDRPTTRLLAVAFCTPDDGEEMFEPIERAPFLESALERVERATTTLQTLYDRSAEGMPKGKRYSVDGVWTNAAASPVIDSGRRILDTLPTRESFLFWMLWGHFPEASNACWSTQAALYFSPNAIWTDAEEDLANETWAHDALGDLAAIDDGTQFSDANPGDRPDRGLEPIQAARLEELRLTYDPYGRFSSYLTPLESTTALASFRRAEHDDAPANIPR